jgi:hypothetical protein
LIWCSVQIGCRPTGSFVGEATAAGRVGVFAVGFGMASPLAKTRVTSSWITVNRPSLQGFGERR